MSTIGARLDRLEQMAAETLSRRQKSLEPKINLELLTDEELEKLIELQHIGVSALDEDQLQWWSTILEKYLVSDPVVIPKC